MYDYTVYNSVTGEVIALGECTAEEIDDIKVAWMEPFVEIGFVNQIDGFPY